eukprot:2916779-Amphidinium_carterae.1
MKIRGGLLQAWRDVLRTWVSGSGRSNLICAPIVPLHVWEVRRGLGPWETQRERGHHARNAEAARVLIASFQS